MTTTTHRLLLIVAVLLGPAVTAQDSKLKLLATVPTYGRLAETIGGDLIDVQVVCRPGQDIHGVAPTPSMMARFRRSDLLIATGLDAEPWLVPMLRSSDNARLLPGIPSNRVLLLSDGIPLKQVPAVITRAAGDVHAFGNTHVWTDPYHVRTMAGRVKDLLVAHLPEHADEIQARHKTFHDKLTKALIDWIRRLQTVSDKQLVVFHQSWIYLLERFGIERVGTLEPKPRMPPTPSHLATLVTTMKARGTKIILREPWNYPAAADTLAKDVDGTVLVLSTHPGYPDGVDGVIEHFEHNVTELERVLSKSDR